MTEALRNYFESRERGGPGYSQQTLADELGVRQASVSRWVYGRVPAERVLAVEAATGVPRQKLRPDLYPPE